MCEWTFLLNSNMLRAGSKVLNQLYGGDVGLIIQVLEHGAPCAGQQSVGEGGEERLDCHG